MNYEETFPECKTTRSKNFLLKESLCVIEIVRLTADPPFLACSEEMDGFGS